MLAPFRQHTHPWVRWIAPRLYVQTTPPHFTLDELDDFIHAARSFADEVDTHFAVISDLSALIPSRVDAVMRKRFAEHLKSIENTDRAHCALSAVVTRNSLQRGLLTAVLWMAPPVYPHIVTTSMDEAVAACEDVLSARASLPPTAR